MGGCTSDFYTMVKREHGEMFQKFIVGSQSLCQLQKIVKYKQQQYDVKAEEKRQSINKELNERQQIMLTQFNEVKINLAGQLPETIVEYQNMKNDKIENILGLQEYKKRFLGVHDQVSREINLRKLKTNQQLENIIKQTQQEQTVDPQQMRLYHETSEQKRTQIKNKAVKQFASNINKKINDLQTKYAQILDVDLQLKKLDKVISMQQVNHLINMAKNKFKNQAVNVMGGFRDSDINA